MTNCNPRTDSFGQPYGLQSAARESSSLPRGSDQQKDWESGLPYQPFKLGELLSLRRSNGIQILVHTLLSNGFTAADSVEYCHNRATHYIKTKTKIYVCRKGMVQQFKLSIQKAPSCT